MKGNESSNVLYQSVPRTELPVAECVRTAQDRTAWRAKVSLALAFDPQE